MSSVHSMSSVHQTRYPPSTPKPMPVHSPCLPTELHCVILYMALGDSFYTLCTQTEPRWDQWERKVFLTLSSVSSEFRRIIEECGAKSLKPEPKSDDEELSTIQVMHQYATDFWNLGVRSRIPPAEHHEHPLRYFESYEPSSSSLICAYKLYCHAVALRRTYESQELQRPRQPPGETHVPVGEVAQPTIDMGECIAASITKALEIALGQCSLVSPVQLVDELIVAIKVEYSGCA